MDCSMPGIPVLHCLLESAQTHVRWVGGCHPVISSSVTPFSCPQGFPASGYFPMSQFLVSGWPKYWSFSFSINLSSEYSGLISLNIDWFDLLTVQGTLRSLLQHHSSKASVLQCSALFMVQLSHSCMTTVKTIALTIWTFFGKVISPLFKTLSRFVIAILPRSNCLLISWLQSRFPLILEPKKMKSDTVSTFSLFPYFFV